LEETGAEWNMILECILEKWEVVNLHHMTEDRYQWWALVNTAINIKRWAISHQVSNY